MAGDSSYDAVVIAGGRSTRFGSDKAFLDWRGTPLFLHQLETLRQLSPTQLFVSGNEDQDFDLPEDTRLVLDEKPDLGPIGGLVSAFRSSTAEEIIVLGVDLPLMTSSFLAALQGGKVGHVPKIRYWEPLAAVYPRLAILEHLESAIANNELKLQALLDRAEAEGLIEAVPVKSSDELLFTNLNARSDLPEFAPNRFDDEVAIERFRAGEGFSEISDHVAAEEPLEVRVNGTSVSVMMRTPGHDDELAIGFLVTEGVISNAGEVSSIEHLDDVDRTSAGNTLEVTLASALDLASLTRHVFTSSSCGVCGKATIDSVFQQFPELRPPPLPDADVVLSLPSALRHAQETFEKTGGLHASALFSRKGELLLLREDVGRHNALDKVIGRGLQDGIEFKDVILLVSGRISFELTQKALAVGIPIIAGISAPTSLAVDLAKRSGQVLIGFLREKGFNRYA
ncbi:MAG: formate dehydrogenase accessory sulfurtransferase FdhD [Verrucomicrobiota bacterium]